MNRTPPDIHPRFRLFLSSSECEGLFGSGKWLLLDAIRKEGSLQKAAKRLNRGYRKAWGDIRIAEQGLGFPLVRRTRGGRDGGHSQLTPAGLALSEAWNRFHARAAKDMERHFQKLIKPILKSHTKGALS